METCEPLETFRTAREGALVLDLVAVLMRDFTVTIAEGEEENIGELEVGGRLDFEGDRARGRDVFATTGMGGGGICSRAEAAAVFLAALFLGTTRRAD